MATRAVPVAGVGVEEGGAGVALVQGGGGETAGGVLVDWRWRGVGDGWEVFGKGESKEEKEGRSSGGRDVLL